MPNLLIPVGVPGSGKSTWAKNLLDLKYAVVSTDAIRIEKYGSLLDAHAVEGSNALVFDEYHRRIREKLSHGVDVFADATNLTVASRYDLRQNALSVPGVKTHVIVFKNLQQAIRRNEERPHDRVVPESVMAAMVARFYDSLSDLADGEAGLFDSVTYIESLA